MQAPNIQLFKLPIYMCLAELNLTSQQEVWLLSYIRTVAALRTKPQNQLHNIPVHMSAQCEALFCLRFFRWLPAFPLCAAITKEKCSCIPENKNQINKQILEYLLKFTSQNEYNLRHSPDVKVSFTNANSIQATEILDYRRKTVQWQIKRVRD